MKRNTAFAAVIAATCAAAAYAQPQPATQDPATKDVAPQSTTTPGTVNPQATDPGTATPGTVNPQATDPSTATPGIVSPGAASSPHQRDVTGSVEAQEANPSTGYTHGANPGDASSPHQRAAVSHSKMRVASAGAVTAGTTVQSEGGDPVGVVRDIVPDPATGQPSYVLIATTAGGRIAVPYSTAVAVTREGKLMLDAGRIQNAPRVQDRQLLDASNTQWKRDADQYWNGDGSARP